MEKVTLTQLTSLIGKLTSTYQAVSPAPFHYRELQMYHIKMSQEGQPFETEVRMTKECWRDMNWWLNNLKLNRKKKTILIPLSDLIIQSNSATTGDWMTN